MKKTLLDSSFLFALINQKDANHAACVEVARDTTLHKHLPVTVIPETCYLLHRWLGHPVMRAFVRNLQDPMWQIEQIQPQDWVRVDALLKEYADARLDLVDATLVAAAERLKIETILTLDQRDFRLIRPSHINYFTVLPMRQ
ncbi:type II toxin-antitoxin system VapC family toxin [Candidatus Leptofilum sp.]|uniref:type II toxin-antitoxin system VapC family toxin n=1 Tax=Candidatus Leptofilum sp. TaxID=3241576 RepID=UPI003B5C4AE1